LAQVHDVFRVAVFCVVDDDGLDVAPALAVADAHEFFAQLGHFDLAAPDYARVFLVPGGLDFGHVDFAADAVPAGRVRVVPTPVCLDFISYIPPSLWEHAYVVGHHPDVVVFALVLPCVTEERAFVFRAQREVVEREGELDIRH
jgi:hypothetical protein